jgi:hypothetical protein
MRRAISLAGLGIALASVAISMGSVRPAPIKVVETYERKCSSCHGKEGAMLDKDFEKKYASPSELREVVESMPGAIGMRSDELDAMLAYMRADESPRAVCGVDGSAGRRAAGRGVARYGEGGSARQAREAACGAPPVQSVAHRAAEGGSPRGGRNHSAARYSAYHAAPQGLPLQPHEISYAAKSLSALRATAFSGSMSSAIRNCSRASSARPISRRVIAKFSRASR